MARPEHITNYRSSLIPTPQLPPEGNTSKGGATSKGGTSRNAAAVPTTDGPTHYKKDTEDPPAHNMQSKKAPIKSSTEEAILTYLNTVPRQLAPRQLA